FLGCLHAGVRAGEASHAGVFTRGGFNPVTATPGTRHYPCHFAIWSGCLYRLTAVRQIGLPDPDYVLDCGEVEYGYRVMKAGYKGFLLPEAIFHHNIRGHTSITEVKVKLGPIKFTLYEFPPIRCYYTCRNLIYFALYDFKEERLAYLRSISRWMYGF